MNKILALILLLATASAPVTALAIPSDSHAEGIESVAENLATLSSGNSELTITNPGSDSMTFHIFSITGQMVKAVTVESGDRISIELPAGCYIVKCSQWSKKIVVR